MASSGIHVCLASCWAICALTDTGCDSLLGKEPNPGYCGSATCPDAGGCRSNADCTSPGAGVCDVMATKQCVQCTATDHAACTGNAPVCSTDNTCRACAAHEECDSNACSFATGACAAETDVAYVSSTGADNSTCDKSAPCASITAALMTGRHYVKIHGTIDGAVVVDKGRTVTLLADPSAMLTRGSGGDVLTVKDTGTSLTIYDLTISGAQTPSVGIALAGGVPALSLIRVTVSNNAGGGIASAGSLTIDHSTITGNGSGGPGISITGGSLSLAQSLVSANHGGGVDVTGTTAKFAIVSNKFVGNGAGDPMGSLIGAVNIRANFAITNLLEFNTFYKNLSTDGIGAAIQCDPATFTARANIMFGNGTATNLDPTSGTCMHMYSLAKPGTVPTGTGNLGSDPLFVDAPGGNFHLQAGSPAIGAANALAPLTGLSARDFDDHPRTSPVNLGALQ
ncbi:MAG TPA: right-handed parallel beta-helix repeat-containing protein [Kofleriaceae bacterium]